MTKIVIFNIKSQLTHFLQIRRSETPERNQTIYLQSGVLSIQFQINGSLHSVAPYYQLPIAVGEVLFQFISSPHDIQYRCPEGFSIFLNLRNHNWIQKKKLIQTIYFWFQRKTLGFKTHCQYVLQETCYKVSNHLKKCLYIFLIILL